MGYFKTGVISSAIILSGCHTSFQYGTQKMLDRDGVKLITVRVNGERSTLIVDSGAKTTMLNKAFCEEMGIKFQLSAETVSGIGGVAKLYKTETIRIEILGNIIPYKANVGDLSSVVRAFSNSHLNVHGVLGADFLNSNGCIINYRTNTLECGNETRKKDSNPLH